MHMSYSRLVILLLSSTLILGCQMLPDTGEKAGVDDLSLTSIVRQNEQINAAIHLLETGDRSTARRLIDQVLEYNAKHPTANLLHKQLTQSAESIFNTSRQTTYVVKSGDSLGVIAQKWLGNSLYFVTLAKLNNISKPVTLQPGTKIKIPVTEKSEIVVKEQRRSRANIGLIKQYREKKDFYKGLEKSNKLFIVDQDLKKLFHEQQLILDALANASVSLSDRSNMLKQVTSYAKLSRSQQQKSLYQRFLNAQNRLLFLDEAVLLFEDQSYMDAAERLVNAKKLDENMDKETVVFRMEKLLLNKLHEQAVVLYRNHSLKQALDRWSLILQLDPDNELAKKYTERTHKLLKKLNQY